MPPKKIAFILPNVKGGGAERVTLTLLRYLDRKDFHPTLLLLKREGNLLEEAPEDVPVLTALEPGQRIRHHFLSIGNRIAKNAGKIDLFVGALELDATYYAYILGKMFDKPSIGWVHTIIEPYLHRVAKYHRPLIKLVYPQLDHVIFPSLDALTDMRKFSGLRLEKTSFIQNPVDLCLIEKKSREPLPEWARPIFSKPVLIGLGRLEYGKGFDLLLQAHIQLCKKGWDHNLLILGAGDMKNELLQVACNGGVKKSVFLPGFVPNPYPFIRHAKVLVHPARFEGFGMVLLEAMALGTPVVASRCSSAPVEILGNGQYGLLFKNGNLDELVEHLSLLISVPATYDSFRNVCLQRSQEFKPDHAVQEWQKILWQTLQT